MSYRLVAQVFELVDYGHLDQHFAWHELRDGIEAGFGIVVEHLQQDQGKWPAILLRHLERAQESAPDLRGDIVRSGFVSPRPFSISHSRGPTFLISLSLKPSR
jgi:hypothetical protein